MPAARSSKTSPAGGPIPDRPARRSRAAAGSRLYIRIPAKKPSQPGSGGGAGIALRNRMAPAPAGRGIPVLFDPRRSGARQERRRSKSGSGAISISRIASSATKNSAAPRPNRRGPGPTGTAGREMQILKNLGDTLQACNSREEAYPFLALAATRTISGSQGRARRPRRSRARICSRPPPNGAAMSPLHQARWMKPDFAVDDCWALRRGSMHEPGVGTVCHHFQDRPCGALCLCPSFGSRRGVGVAQHPFPQTQPLDDERRAALSAFGNAVALGLSTLQLRETMHEQPVHGR